QLVESSTMNRLDLQSNMFDEGPSTRKNKSQQYSINGFTFTSSQLLIPKEFMDINQSEEEPNEQPNKTTSPPIKNKARSSTLDSRQNKTSNQNKKTRSSSLDANFSKQNNNELEINGSTSNLNLSIPEEAKNVAATLNIN
ncbi:9411_t:CDS:2, partial [Gigaspora rosea]